MIDKIKTTFFILFVIGCFLICTSQVFADAKVWKQMETPISESSIDLYDVWGSSAGNVFAVGKQGTILHYDGQKWSKMDSNTSSDLYKVWGLSENNVYALGRSWVSGSQAHRNIILNYNGSEWKEIKQITLHSSLTDIWADSKDNIFIVMESDYIDSVPYLKFNGKEYREIKTVDFCCPLKAIWAESSNNIFASGKVMEVSSKSMSLKVYASILHYNGKKWEPMLKEEIFGWLADIWGSSDNNIFAVGCETETISGGAAKALVLHYNGQEWVKMSLPHPYPITIGPLEAVSGNKDNVFAVGYGGQIIYYDGDKWEKMASPTNKQLRGVWAGPGNNIFVVGDKSAVLVLTQGSIDNTEAVTVTSESGKKMDVESMRDKLLNFVRTYSKDNTFTVYIGYKKELESGVMVMDEFFSIGGFGGQLEREDIKNVFKQAIDIIEQEGQDSVALGLLLIGESMVYRRGNEFNKAITLAEKALPVFEKYPGPDQRDLAAALVSLSYTYSMAGVKLKYAESLAKRAVEIYENTNADKMAVIEALGCLSFCYSKQGNFDKADEVEKQISRITR